MIPDISGTETQEARQRAFAEAFEAMREALSNADRWLATEINTRTLSRRDARRQIEVLRKARAALALADKVRQ